MTGRTDNIAHATGAAASQDLAPWLRLPMMVLGFASLVIGVLAGEARLGWQVPQPAAELMALHGALMVSGFLGTLISLERAVALGRRVAYLGPAASAVGALLLIVGVPVTAAALLFMLGSVGLVAASFAAYQRQRALHTLTLFLGASLWLAGNVQWLFGGSIPSIVPWWATFLVLTIAGERLELSRLVRLSALAQRMFALLIALLLVELAAISLHIERARHVYALLLFILTVWLVRNDIARRTIRNHGLTRFIAVCLLSGYLWLAVGALIGLAGDGMFASGTYDATLHAVFLGFVFSMVFGHAPVILPSVTRLALPYHGIFYVHWALLQFSLLLRLSATVPAFADWRSLAAALNGFAILLFFASTLTSLVRGRRRRASGPASSPL